VHGDPRLRSLPRFLFWVLSVGDPRCCEVYNASPPPFSLEIPSHYNTQPRPLSNSPFPFLSNLCCSPIVSSLLDFSQSDFFSPFLFFSPLVLVPEHNSCSNNCQDVLVVSPFFSSPLFFLRAFICGSKAQLTRR